MRRISGERLEGNGSKPQSSDISEYSECKLKRCRPSESRESTKGSCMHANRVCPFSIGNSAAARAGVKGPHLAVSKLQKMKLLHMGTWAARRFCNNMLIATTCRVANDYSVRYASPSVALAIWRVCRMAICHRHSNPHKGRRLLCL